MYLYVCGLSDNEYQEWIEDTSLLTDVRLFHKNIDGFLCGPWVWALALIYALWRSLLTDWDSVMLCEQALLGIVMALTVALLELVEPVKPQQMPKQAHFLLMGLAKKYKHSCWAPSVIPSLGLALICYLLDWTLGLLSISILGLLHPKKGHGAYLMGYITRACAHMKGILNYG